MPWLIRGFNDRSRGGSESMTGQRCRAVRLPPQQGLPGLTLLSFHRWINDARASLSRVEGLSWISHHRPDLHMVCPVRVVPLSHHRRVFRFLVFPPMVRHQIMAGTLSVNDNL